MKKLKSIAEEVHERLEKEGRITRASFSPEVIMRMHEEAKKIIRESRRKQAASLEAAKHIYLD